jgi:hypothetical protein
MRESISELGTKTLAVAVLLVAAWVLFKVVLGALTFVAWIFLAVGAVLAVLWALSKLL